MPDFVTIMTWGGLAANCSELHLCVDVPRRAGDPTRAEMLRELIRAFRWRRDGRKDECWKFDVEAAIYWFSAHWHGGQWSNLYSALSTSPYRPGRSDGPELDSAQVDMYQHLIETFCPRIKGGAK